jgi:hypothetical protein
MKVVAKLYGHFVYCTTTWYIVWPFGIFCGHLVYFVAIWVYFMAIRYILWSFWRMFWYVVPRKTWQPC